MALSRPRIASMFAMALLLAFSSSSFAIWPFGVYRFDAISGTVLDKETRKPIEGVVVLGHWGLEGNTLMNSYYAGPLVVKETMTDKDGKFMIPASVATDVHKRGHFNSERYPEIAFFKSGYDFVVYRHNGKEPLRPNEVYNTLKENEYTMPKWPSDKDAQVEMLKDAHLALTLTNTSGVCSDFEMISPSLLAALRAERERIAKTDSQLAGSFAYRYALRSMETCILDIKMKRNGKSL